MAEYPLHGQTILIVEDEYLIAEQVRSEFADAGAIVLGPAATIANALRLVTGKPFLDGAVLDISLGTDKAFPVADRLLHGSVPFVFLTGYSPSMIPHRFRHVTVCEKPVITGVTNTIARLIHAHRRSIARQRMHLPH